MPKVLTRLADIHLPGGAFMPDSLVPAAQYLRMSTDHQQYSLDNQADAIARYAAERNFRIVKTYSDAARSGVRLKNRPGLKQLLKDVVAGNLEFQAILVYDVSRWGRFQDIDEAAHYEYLCKSSGVPILYCAELFSNDNSTSGLILKALKRTMAGEYSRELSIKVRTGLLRLAKLGYKQGGHAPYGLRRQLLDVHGKPKQLLADGERKTLTTERVILVPGIPEEVAVVRRVFHEFADEHRSLSSIAARLNSDGVPFVRGARWNANAVVHALERRQYVGSNVWGRTTAFLSSPPKRLPPECWAVCNNAFEPIISQQLFDRAQKALANLTCRVSNDELLERLKPLLKKHGKLSAEIIQRSRACAGGQTYYKRFGGLLNVYTRLGYDTPELCAQATSRQRGMLVRRSLIQEFLASFPNELKEIRPSKRFRALLRLRTTGLIIAVVIARYRPTRKSKARWLIEAPKTERKRVTILGLMDDHNSSIKEIRIFRRMDYPKLTFRFRADNQWLQTGEPLTRISDFLEVLQHFRKAPPSAAG